MVGVPAQIDRFQHPVARGEECRQGIAHQPHHQHLGLGVAEADIEFEQHRARFGQHQPGIEDAFERPALARHRGDRGQYDALHDRSLKGRRDVRARRGAPHPASVRPRVAFADPFVILRSCKRQRIPAVDQRVKARLLAGQQILDNDLGSSGTEPALDQRRVDRPVSRIEIGRDRDPLAGGEAVGLYYDRCPMALDKRLGRPRIAEPAMGSGRDAGPHA